MTDETTETVETTETRHRDRGDHHVETAETIVAPAALSQDELREAFGTDGEGTEASAPIVVALGEDDGAAPAEPDPRSTGRGLGTGRRKEAVARVRLIPGEGTFTLNGRSLEEYFPARAHRMLVTAPLRTAGRREGLRHHRASARLVALSGQAGALRLSIARALIDLDGTLRPAMKAEGLLTRDAREKERRKYGLKKARKAPQYSKR